MLFVEDHIVLSKFCANVIIRSKPSLRRNPAGKKNLTKILDIHIRLCIWYLVGHQVYIAGTHSVASGPGS